VPLGLGSVTKDQDFAGDGQISRRLRPASATAMMPEPVGRPFEEGDPQPLLKQVHQPAYRSRRYVQPRSGIGEGAVARRGLEGL
jgi:hypothetical protein